MPLKPIDFSKTIIYKIWKDDDFYVGSTTDFASRKHRHKSNCSNEKSHHYNLKVYQTIRDKGGWDTWEMIPLEEYVDCQNKTQARIREEEWCVKLNASLNMKKAYNPNPKQEYRQKHKEHIAEYNTQYFKQYYQNHREELTAKQSVKYECECGSICRIGKKSRHLQTKKHQTYLATL